MEIKCWVQHAEGDGDIEVDTFDVIGSIRHHKLKDGPGWTV